MTTTSRTLCSIGLSLLLAFLSGVSMRAEPPAGAALQSQGDYAVVPDLVGKGGEEIRAILAHARLTGRIVWGPIAPDKSLELRMAGQTPAAGTRVRTGTVVVITVYKANPCAGVPNVVHRSLSDAVVALENCGLTVAGIEVGHAPTPAQEGRVYAQNPMWGAPIPESAAARGVKLWKYDARPESPLNTGNIWLYDGTNLGGGSTSPITLTITEYEGTKYFVSFPNFLCDTPRTAAAPGPGGLLGVGGGGGQPDGYAAILTGDNPLTLRVVCGVHMGRNQRTFILTIVGEDLSASHTLNDPARSQGAITAKLRR